MLNIKCSHHLLCIKAMQTVPQITSVRAVIVLYMEPRQTFRTDTTTLERALRGDVVVGKISERDGGPIRLTLHLKIYIFWFGLFSFLGALTPQQQPGSYRGGEEDEMSVLLVEETGVPGGNHWPAASNWQTFTHTASAQSQNERLSSLSYRGPIDFLDFPTNYLRPTFILSDDKFAVVVVVDILLPWGPAQDCNGAVWKVREVWKRPKSIRHRDETGSMIKVLPTQVHLGLTQEVGPVQTVELCPGPVDLWPADIKLVHQLGHGPLRTVTQHWAVLLLHVHL